MACFPLKLSCGSPPGGKPSVRCHIFCHMAWQRGLLTPISSFAPLTGWTGLREIVNQLIYLD
jgi:hypothetical protein